MKGSDIVLIGLTFFTGLFAGAYLYVSVFMPAYVAPEPVGIADTRFEVAGEMLGACGSEVCPSFILKEDRSYVYVPGYALREHSPEPVTGKLSGLLVREVEAAARATVLSELAGACPTSVTVNAYRYRVVVDGEAYDLTTCNPTFANTALADVLFALWGEVAVAQSAPPAVLEEGVFGGLERYLRDQFQWNQE